MRWSCYKTYHTLSQKFWLNKTKRNNRSPVGLSTIRFEYWVLKDIPIITLYLMALNIQENMNTNSKSGT